MEQIDGGWSSRDLVLESKENGIDWLVKGALVPV